MSRVFILGHAINAVFRKKFRPLLNVATVEHGAIFSMKILDCSARCKRLVVCNRFLLKSWQHLEPHYFTIMLVHRTNGSFRDQAIRRPDVLAVELEHAAIGYRAAYAFLYEFHCFVILQTQEAR